MLSQSQPVEVIRNANNLIRQGLLGAASDLLTEGLEAYPDDAHLLRALARVRMLERRPSDAVPLLQRALHMLQRPGSGSSPSEIVDSQQRTAADGSDETVPTAPVQSTLINALGVDAPLPASDFEYVAAVEYEVVVNRDYEPGLDPVTRYERRHRYDETVAAAGQRELDQLAGSAADKNNVPMDLDPCNSAEIPPIQLPPNEIQDSLPVDAHTESDDKEDEGPTIEDVYIDEVESAENGADTESILDEIKDELGSFEAESKNEIQPDAEKRDYEPSLDDFGDGPADELPTREEMFQAPSRITREERARQVAVDLAIEFGWDRAGVELLSSIFVKHWWGAARAAMRREMQAGATLKDITLADALREIWHGYPEFSYHIDYRGNVSQRYTVLPWPTALALVRAFEGAYPDEAELESFLVDAYEMWWDDAQLKEQFNSLYNFIRYRVSNVHENNGLSPWYVFRQELSELDARGHLSIYQELESRGVSVPDWETGKLSDVNLKRSEAIRMRQEEFSAAIAGQTGSDDDDEQEIDQEADL